MKTIELSGTIKLDWDNWEKIKLVQDDGYKIDLIGRVKEATESYSTDIQVSYYISSNKITKREMIENHLKKLYGYCDASYESSDYAHSSWTTGTNYDSNLTIGGHNLFKELKSHEGKFILIILNFKSAGEGI